MIRRLIVSIRDGVARGLLRLARVFVWLAEHPRPVRRFVFRVVHRIAKWVRDRPAAVWVREHPNPVALLGVTVAFVAVLAALTFAIVQNRHLARDGREAHDALCVFKADLEQRADDSQAFIDHPPATIIGIPVTPELIAGAQSQVNNQRATLASLKGLDCASVS